MLELIIIPCYTSFSEVSTEIKIKVLDSPIWITFDFESHRIELIKRQSYPYIP
jgi:hypothetical protein